MCRRACIGATVLLVSAMAGSASARQAPATEWSHGTTLNGFGGMTADAKQSGPVLGGAVGWELTPDLAIEGSGGWTEFGHGTSSFAGALKARIRLFGQRKVDPFVQAGVGLYRVTFGPTDTAVPEFYARRMRSGISAESERRFTDPSVVAGGGVSVFVNRHLAIRPDAEAAVVFRGGHSHVVTTIAVHVVYHFEDHPVTPVRR
jgi:hypothetical protein